MVFSGMKLLFCYASVEGRRRVNILFVLRSYRNFCNCFFGAGNRKILPSAIPVFALSRLLCENWIKIIHYLYLSLARSIKIGLQ